LDGPWDVLFPKIAPNPRVIFWPTFFRQKSQAFVEKFRDSYCDGRWRRKTGPPNRDEPRGNEQIQYQGKTQKSKHQQGTTQEGLFEQNPHQFPSVSFPLHIHHSRWEVRCQGAGRKSPTNFNRILDQRD
jgi:hypothetical protein